MSATLAPPEPMENRLLRRPPLSPIVLILALGLAIRLWRLTAQSLSMDEIFDYRLASEAVSAIVFMRDGFPPLYHLLAHWWLRVVPDPLSLRVLSVMLGMLTITAIWQLGRLAGGERCGLISAFLLAISPIHVWFSQEARGYALYFLLAVTTIWLFYRARTMDRDRDWLCYLGAAVLALYTHYYIALLLLALFLTLALETRRLVNLRRLVRTHLALGVLSLPALILLQGDLHLQQSVELVRPKTDLIAIAYAGFTFLAGFTLGPSLRELHFIRPAEAIRGVLPWAAVIGTATLYLASLSLRDWSQRQWVWRLGLLVIVPLAIGALLDGWLEIGFRVRYLAWCAAPLLTLLAIGAAGNATRRGAWVALAVLAGASAVALANRQLVDRHQNENLRDTAQYLASVTDAETPIFVMSGFMASPLRFYLNDQRNITPLYGVPPGEGTSALIHQVEEGVGSTGPFWLVYTRAFDGDPQGLLLDSLKTRAGLLRRSVLAGVEIYEGQGF